jgi:hypothetical protein
MITKLFKQFNTTLIFCVSLVLLCSFSFAQDASVASSCDPCNPQKCVSDSSAESEGTNLWSLNQYVWQAFLNTSEKIFSGTSVNEKVGCTKYLVDKLPGFTLPDGATSCSTTPDTDCESQVNVIESPNQYSSAGSKSAVRSGSLLSYAYQADNYMQETPPYANLAYFVGKNTEKIPFVNKAFAQAVSGVDYRHSLISVVYDIWQVTRNVSLALMSIILLVIGIMIILRKKVNQQVIVSVQYALPKIILAFILIIMSYPIGATITSLSWTLYNNARLIVAGMFSGMVGGTLPEITPGFIIGAIVISIVTTTLSGGLVLPGLFLITSFVGVTVVLLYAYFLIRAFLLYIKMVVSIVSAPIEFVIGAVPGSDDKVAGWFKRMLIYGISLFLMKAIFWLGLHVAFVIVTTGFQSGASGFLISVLVPILILVYTVGVANSIESKVQKFVDPASVKR